MTEVRDASTGEKGLFATREYQIGDVILEEAAPLLRVEPLTGSSLLKHNLKTGQPKDDGTGSPQTGTEIPVPESVESALHSKFRTMVQMALTSLSLDDTTVSSLTSLYTPSLDTPSEHETSIVQLSHAVLDYLRTNAVKGSPLETALRERKETIQSLMLVWACNAFAGGRIYRTVSRINHSCNPNAIVQTKEGDDNGQILKAATPIRAGDELSISYLPGLFLYADTATRQARLKADKYFHCSCSRCTGNTDAAWTIPCPQCHPRLGRQLEEDVQYDDDQQVHYISLPSLSCQHCDFTYMPDQKLKNLSEHERLLTTCRTVTAKVVDYLQDRERYLDTSDDEEIQAVRHEQLEQQISLASSVLGARHWTTNMLLLLQLQHHLNHYHASILHTTMENDAAMEAVAEAIDLLQRLVRFMEQMQPEIHLHMGHLLSDVVIGTARALVSLGDSKSQTYASEWLAKISDYVEQFESDAMKKVVGALGEAYQRTQDQSTNGDEASRPEKRLKTV